MKTKTTIETEGDLSLDQIRTVLEQTPGPHGYFWANIWKDFWK